MRRLAIVAVVRDEGPRLIEWLAFHRAAGVRDFVIYDDRSRDDTAAILRAHERLGVIAVPWPEARGSAHRLTPQDHFLNSRARLFAFAAFLGPDEFLMPPPGRGIGGWLSRIPPHAGAIVFAPQVFGLSEAGANDLVLRRPTHAGTEPADARRPAPSLYRRGAIAAMRDVALPDLVQGERLTVDFQTFEAGRRSGEDRPDEIRIHRYRPGSLKPGPAQADAAARREGWIGPTLDEMRHVLADAERADAMDFARIRAHYAAVPELAAPVAPRAHALWRLRQIQRRRLEAAGRGLRRLVVGRGPRPW